MAVVRIPGPLRRHVEDAPTVEIAGATLGDVVRALVGRFPSLGEHILNDTGEMQPFIHVFVRGQPETDMTTNVAAADEVLILPSVAGGAPA